MTKSMAEHLIDHSRTIVKDFGKERGRRLLRQNIPVWRAAYGQSVVRDVIKGIQQILGDEK